MTGPHLSLIIPALNESARLPATLQAVVGAMATWPFETEVLIVDDGSTDGTPELVRERAGHDARFRLVRHPRNLGKGAAIVSGVEASRGARVLFFDADLSYPLASVVDALSALDAGADLVVGARDLAAADSRATYGLARRLSTRAFNAFVEATLRLGVRDTQCGFKGFRGEVARALFPDLVVTGFGFDVELLFAARRRGLAVALLPLEMTPRPGSSVHIVRDSLRMARDVLRVRVRGWLGRYDRG
jgi:dolichyl-phosphate beta-glucosyltransferase